jgi:hypothetical protein
MSNTGHDVNYYLVRVDHPKRLDPYTMEVEDIIEALDMTFAEGCVFKALIRSCMARKTGVIKANYDGVVYDSEKMVYYSKRRLAQELRKVYPLPAADDLEFNP